MKKKKSKILTILLIFFLGLFLVSLYKVVTISAKYEEANKNIESIQDDFTHVITQNDNVEDLREDEKEVGQIVDFEALRAKNSDVLGWMYLEGTKINYPVVQSHDNNDYLRRGVDKSYSYYGTPFIDKNCKGIGGSKNTIIYGHNMNNGMMFGSLVNYSKQSYYDEHPEIILMTPEMNYKVLIVSSNIVSAYSDVYRRIEGSDCVKLIRDLQKKSSIKTVIEISDSDTLITFSTCALDFDAARRIVIGKLVPMI